jgi:hypothetical protein
VPVVKLSFFVGGLGKEKGSRRDVTGEPIPFSAEFDIPSG